MYIVKQIISILAVSIIVGLTINAFSPRGISIVKNPWMKIPLRSSSQHPFGGSQSKQDEPIHFVDFDGACQFVDEKAGMVLEARNPEDYAEGHIPGARLIFFLQHD